MQSRMVMTSFWRDELVISLSRDERDFFLYLLTSPDIAYAGIGLLPEKIIEMDLGFSRDVIQFCKKQLGKHNRAFFYENWVCLPNFWRHNPMLRNESVIEATGNYLSRIPRRVYDFFNNKLKELEAPMSLDGYLEKRRRNQAKKMLRKQNKYLMGQQLEEEVDRVLGISDSGKMDWSEIKKVEVSNYPTEESITEKEVRDVAQQFTIRPYKLYWVFLQRVTKAHASGKKKYDYLAFLRECASQALKKDFSDEEKVTAALFWGQFTHVSVTRQQAELLLFKGEL